MKWAQQTKMLGCVGFVFVKRRLKKILWLHPADVPVRCATSTLNVYKTGSTRSGSCTPQLTSPHTFGHRWSANCVNYLFQLSFTKMIRYSKLLIMIGQRVGVPTSWWRVSAHQSVRLSTWLICESWPSSSLEEDKKLTLESQISQCQDCTLRFLKLRRASFTFAIMIVNSVL